MYCLLQVGPKHTHQPLQQPECSTASTMESAAGRTAASAASAAEEGTATDNERYITSLLDSLSDDVYSCTVKHIVKGESQRCVTHVMALVFCLFLQVAMLVLLWLGLSSGSATSAAASTSDTDRLWQQVGQVQRQVCWLNQHAVINSSVAFNTKLECSGAWPLDLEPSPVPVGVDALKDCLHIWNFTTFIGTQNAILTQHNKSTRSKCGRHVSS